LITGGPKSHEENPRMASAVRGLPPIASTSLTELAAHIEPKVYGSSTMGVMTSTVSTVRTPLRRNTPASSPGPITTPLFRHLYISASISERSAGPSFAAQPPALTFSVSFTFFMIKYNTLKVFSCQRHPHFSAPFDI
jgi:hypothetical protein